MSSELFQEISQLVALARYEDIHNHDAIKELTMIVGYAYLAESHPQCWENMRNHLHALMDFACTNGHLEVGTHSLKISKMIGVSEQRDAA